MEPLEVYRSKIYKQGSKRSRVSPPSSVFFFTITGNKTFSGVKVTGTLEVGTLYVGGGGAPTFNLTTMPWQHLSGVDQDLSQTSAVTFADVTTDALTVAGTAVTPASYVTLGGTQTITGDKTFSGALNAASLLVAGTAVTPASYVTLGGTQTITGNKTFSGSLAVGPTGQYDLTTMPWQFLQAVDQNLSQTSAVTFAGLTTGSLSIAGTAVTPTNYVTLDGTQTITGDKTFTGALSATSVTVGGTAVTPASYVTLGGTQTITGDKTFSGQVLVGGYDLSTMPWQHLSGVDQDLSQTSAVTFAGVTVPGLTAGLIGATAEGTLQSLALASTNGVVATVANNTLTINTPQNLQMTAAPTFANLWFTGAPFSVGHALQWLNQGVTMDSSPQFAGVNVTGNASAGNLEVYGSTTTDTLTVGGTAVTPTKYVTTDTNQDIGGNKTFLADLLPAGTYVNVGRQNKIFGVVYCNTTWTNNIRVSYSMLPTSVAPSPPVDIGSAENAFGTVYCNDVKIGGQSVTPVNYVTLDTAQTVTGKKLFTEYINIGTAKFGRLRFSTYNNGDSFINGGYNDDSDYFVELWARGKRLFDVRTGYWDGPTEHWGPRRVNFYANNITFHSLGTGRSGFQNTGQSAHIYIHSDGDNYSQLIFGQNGNESNSRTWTLASRRSDERHDFVLYRSPKLTGNGTWQEVIRVDGTTSQVKFSRTEDASSTTTGSATFAGGVGIAKTLHAKDIVAGSLALGGMPMYRQARRNDTLYSLNIGTYNTSTTPDIHMVRIGNQITLTFRLVTFTIATGQPTHLAMYGGIPPDFRPQHHINHAMFLTVNNTYPIQAMCTIDNQGNINIAPIPQVYYTGATNRVEPFSVSFCHYVG